MKRELVASLVAPIFCFLSSCTTDEQGAIQAGALKLSQSEIAKVFPGSTMKGISPGEPLTNYYLKDGIKLIKEADQVIERKWWINDNGQWCETFADGDNMANCGVKIYNDGHRLAWYSDDGVLVRSFILVAGDTEGLERHALSIRQANQQISNLDFIKLIEENK